MQQKSKMRFSLGGLSISHLAFADDFLIFSRVYPPEFQELMGFLVDYQKGFGQLIIRSKSSVICGK